MTKKTSAPIYSNDPKTLTLFHSFVSENKSIIQKMASTVEKACKYRLCADDVIQELKLHAWYAAGKDLAKKQGTGYLMMAIKNRGRDIITQYKAGMFRMTSELSADLGEAFNSTGGRKSGRNSSSMQAQAPRQEGSRHNGGWILCREREEALADARETIKEALAYADTIPDDVYGYGQTRRRIIKGLFDPSEQFLRWSRVRDLQRNGYSSAVGYEHSTQKVFCEYVGSTEKTVRFVIRNLKKHLREQDVL